MTESDTPWVRVCREEEVPYDVPLGVILGDGDTDRVCLARRDDGTPVALWDRCPHRDISLSGGIVRDGLLTCPGHFWRFSLDTGERTDLPEEVARLYPTRVVDGWVETQIPPPPPPVSMREWLLEQARRD